MGELIGYARVSTLEQTMDLQKDALGKAGCGRIFEDTTSGSKADRPGLRAALDYMRPGDTLVFWKLDRVSRSLNVVCQIRIRLFCHKSFRQMAMKPLRKAKPERLQREGYAS